MEILVLAIVVGLVAAGVMWVVGTRSGGLGGRDDRRAHDRDDTDVTDTAVTPPAHPDRPVPGSAPDRARKGQP